MSSSLFNNVANKLLVYESYNILYMYKEDFALNNPTRVGIP